MLGSSSGQDIRFSSWGSGVRLPYRVQMLRYTSGQSGQTFNLIRNDSRVRIPYAIRPNGGIGRHASLRG